MFRGNYEHNLNNQGRVSLPARFRQVLDERYSRKLVLVGLPGYIEAYPEDEYRKKEQEDLGLPQDNPQVLNYLLVQHHNVWEVEVDGQGRILLPPRLRSDQELEREVVFIGMMDRILIFSPDRYKDHLERALERQEESRTLVADLKGKRTRDE